MTDRTREQEEHARRVKLACERVWAQPGVMNKFKPARWVDGVDILYGGCMLPLAFLETTDEP